MGKAVEECTVSLHLSLDLFLIKLAHCEQVLHEFAHQLSKSLLDRVIDPLQLVYLVAEFMSVERCQHEKFFLQLP